MIRLRALPATTIDTALALLVLALGVAECASVEQRGSFVLNALAVAAFAGAVQARRRFPLAAAITWSAVGTLISAVLAAPDQGSIGFLAGVLIAYALGRHADGRRAWVACGVMVAGCIALYVVAPRTVGSDFFFPWAIIIGVVSIGRFVRGRVALGAQLHEAALAAQERLESESALAAADERRRIAREMHDIVAHSISVMVVQAGGARRILDKDPARAANAAAQIEQAGREAMGEMRRLLGLIGGDGGAGRAPAPSLERAGDLLDRARAAGLEVALHERGEPRALSAGLDLAAFRILQEALTNAVKHAGRTHVDVALDWGARELAIEVVDAGGAGTSVGSGGHGLLGMEERARLYGGDLEAGPRSEGGFRVHARLPYAREEVAA